MEKTKRKILILAEGFEEEPYIKKILKFPTINNKIYQFSVINVKGAQRLVHRFQHEYQRNLYDMILIFCDADRGAKTLLNLINEIGTNIFGDNAIAEKLFIFANPVTLQIVLSHFGKVNLTNAGKKSNAPLIEQLTGISNYDASQDQIKNMMSLITFSNYKTMKENLKDVPMIISKTPSTNFLLFINRFEHDDDSWIDDINKLILAN